MLQAFQQVQHKVPKAFVREWHSKLIDAFKFAGAERKFKGHGAESELTVPQIVGSFNIQRIALS